MFLKIISQTPLWVWGLLAFLVWLGYSQSKDRQSSLLRTFATPVAMVALSLYGMAQVFRTSLWSWALWFVSCMVLISLMLWLPAAPGYRYDKQQQRFQLPGSWVPMVVIMCIFFTKYIINISLAITPGLATHNTFTTMIPLLYGVFSGLMMGRSAKLIAMMVSTKPRIALS